MRRKTVPVSTLARFAADPEGFPKPRTRAMERAAAHGVRWHEQLGRRRAGTSAGPIPVFAAVLVILAAAAWLLLAS